MDDIWHIAVSCTYTFDYTMYMNGWIDGYIEPKLNPSYSSGLVFTLNRWQQRLMKICLNRTNNKKIIMPLLHYNM